jgi:F0F1-type ATP synthase epsilon subunit
MSDPTLPLRIFSPLEDFFSGEITSLSSVNSKGAFDILPSHADFISLVDKKTIKIVLPTGERKEFEFNQAVVRVHQGKVEVFTDFAKAEELLPEMKIVG